ncbi:hypothetical protein Xcel_3130 [Xylanimonas cellulosilytica DSM 15894]|uniref:DUF4097 domain-containing protein n=1 Tax=Xylanimonas cellulosilytica (strain DSM 15894 / JCM 12276 / CECT 5975 / KCTC 9989 / LMG 20990 / NBRC 107835 / XIL07) TaxID=446471 RepID=D1C003_XYLCX|nr:DUF4097 family beta strand repeat-containing protein [Xylanimonas cellulosilytica]ACZ32131.1 hypothetical protein Xcel_3130 [Xylanimonas cellulosilytica DSM 15894]
MPTFPAPRPLTVVVDRLAARVHVVASERDDAVVTVLPANPGRASDGRAAQETRVELTGDVLTVSGPTTLRHLVIGPQGMVTVTVEVPAGSGVAGTLAAGPLYTEGPLGAVDVKLSAGDASVEHAARIDLRSSAGSVVVGTVTGPTTVRSSAGSVRIRSVLGDATVRSSAGDVTVGSVTGSLTVTGAHGEIVVGRVRGTVEATTGSGGIRVDSLDSGVATLQTSYGSVEVGVPEGTAAWVDASTQFGQVRNRLTPSDAPSDDAATAELHVTTSYGDVVVRRPESTSPFTGV